MKKIILCSFLLLFTSSIFAQFIQKPRGCYAGTNGTHANVLAHAEARGVLLSYKWSDIELTPGNFNFTNLNNDISTVTNAGLKYSLAIISGGTGSPDWLIDTYGASYFNYLFQGQSARLPLWWDATVQSRLEILIDELGNQYAQDNNLSHIYVTQMSANGIEGHLNGINMTQFSNSGYTDQNWIQSAIFTTKEYADAFPNKPIVFEVHEIDNDTLVPSAIVENLENDPDLCKRFGIGMWWISGKDTYQSDLIDLIANFQGDKYAQIIGRSDQTDRFKNGLYSSVFVQAKALGIRYIEPWPYEFKFNTHDALLNDFNTWADANFSGSDICILQYNRAAIDRENNSISISPNPSNGPLTIEINQDYNQLDVRLFDSKGQELMSTQNKTELSLENIESGIYYVSITVDNDVTTKKILKIE